MLHVIKPQESAAYARSELVKAAKALAEAQQAVLQAAETLDMFEHNFRLGAYLEKTFDYGFSTTKAPPIVGDGR